MIKQHVAQLLETEMDRKDFLKTLAIAAVAMTGVTAVVKNVSSSILTQSTASKKANGFGYGASSYGTSIASSGNSPVQQLIMPL